MNIVMTTNYGPISIELDFENTPKTAENFLEHVRAGHYDGTIFHRVIDGFMIQGGGFEPGMAQKDSGPSIQNEARSGKKNSRGSIAMARTMDPHSASNQFFINVADNAFLNFSSETMEGWGYCVFGQVVAGMETVDAIKAVKTTTRAGHQDVPVEDVVIEQVVCENETLA